VLPMSRGSPRRAPTCGRMRCRRSPGASFDRS
jgi:hypothetical protein